MAYVDQAFSIADDDLNMDEFSSHTVHNNRPPIKEIALAVSLLVFGALAIISGIFMSIYQIGDDRAHGVFFAILGSILFIPGFYYTRIAYYAYKGYKELNAPHDGSMPDNFATEISMSQRTNTATWRKGDDSKKLLL